MGTFRENLRDELDYQNLTVKELSARTAIPKSTLDCYLGARANLPTLDAAVKIATALGVTVEYLATGVIRDRMGHVARDIPKDMNDYLKFRDVLDDLRVLPKTVLEPLKATVKAVAEQERKKTNRLQ
jgi:transcriptional regulator with XRE-family HTH domain